MAQEWLNDFTHESVTDDNREAFVTANEKYDSIEAAVFGGFNAQKETGKPFRLPESMDKLPDDASRAELRAQAHALLGITHAKSVEELADLNLKEGSAEGQQTDDALAAKFKQFIVDEKIPKGAAQKVLKFYNEAMTSARTAHADAAETAKLEAAKATNEALIKHYGSEAEVGKQSELMRRAIKNNLGLSTEEYEAVGDVLADTVLTKNPVMARIMLKTLAPLAAESDNKGAGGGQAPVTQKDPAEGSPTYKALGWSK